MVLGFYFWCKAYIIATVNLFTHKIKNCKKSPIIIFGFNAIKIIVILLVKIVIFYVKLAVV